MYLLTLGGMPDGTWDEHLIRFWPLAEIRPVEGETDSPADPDYFVFDIDPPDCYSCSLNGFNATTYDVPGIFGYVTAAYHLQ